MTTRRKILRLQVLLLLLIVATRSNNNQNATSQCQVDDDCLPHGTCDTTNHNHTTGGQCLCDPGFYGPHCDCPLLDDCPKCGVVAVCDDSNEADSNETTNSICHTNDDCRNGGTCRQNNTCQCPLGVSGDFCQDRLCGVTCQNGGTCVVLRDDHAGLEREYGCHCVNGYSGALCQTAPPQANASTTNNKNNICGVTCQNGGTCVVLRDDHAGLEREYGCHCVNGYTGALCQTAPPQANASTTTNKNNICGVTCQNGGTCVVLRDDHAGLEREYGCQCRNGYSGALCQTAPNNNNTEETHTQMNNDPTDQLNHSPTDNNKVLVVVGIVMPLLFLWLGAVGYRAHTNRRRRQDDEGVSSPRATADADDLPSVA